MQPVNFGLLHGFVHVYVLHRGAELRVALQFLKHGHVAAVPDKVSGKRLAADTVVNVRLNAEHAGHLLHLPWYTGWSS